MVNIAAVNGQEVNKDFAKTRPSMQKGGDSCVSLLATELKGILSRGFQNLEKRTQAFIFEVHHIRYSKSSSNSACSPSIGDTRYCAQHETLIRLKFDKKDI